MDAPWQVRLLGALQVQTGETVLPRFATSRVAALLARLALYPQRAHSREELCDLLWPEAGASAGRLNLRVAIASLRRQLEPSPLRPGSVLVAGRSFVGLNPAAFRCDVGEFEAAAARAARAVSFSAKRDALAQAAALYGGDLLPGFHDEWIVEERERLLMLHEELRALRGGLAAEDPGIDRPPKKEAKPGSAGAGAGPAPHFLRLPVQFTRCFGREQDCARICELLGVPSTRLVTLTGPGGVGKTRLAVESARQIAGQAGSRFQGPLCFVPITGLPEARLIPAAIAGALRSDHAAEADPFDAVVAALAVLPPALLLLDGFEPPVERGVPLILSLLARLPTLTCLITSQRPLSLPGECEYPVLPLPVPPLPRPGGAETPEQVAQAAGVQLFLDRVQAVRPGFQITPENAPAVAAVCRRLEGIPLALELVATRAVVLSPAQMDERLTQRFSLPTDRPAGKSGFPSPVWVAAAWSYDLIPAPLQRFFAGLSVFRGGCTVEAAQAVCDEPQALRFLTQLRERSLVTVEQAGAEPRFRLLETLRPFAEEQLSDEDRVGLRRRHGAYFLALLEEARAALRGPEQPRWRERLAADSDNLRIAGGESACAALPHKR